MKKVLALLLAVFLLSSSLFAATESFTVDTIVDASQGMKLVDVDALSPITVSAFEALPEDTSQYEITSDYLELHNVRKIISYSNAINGYEIRLSAIAMGDASVDSIEDYIDFTVIAGGAEVKTAGTVEAVWAEDPVIYEDSLSNIKFNEAFIKVQVVKEQYDTALSGTYVGTISFNFITHL